MDVYNREFFEPRLGSRESWMGDASIVTTQSLNDDRLRVELDYGHGAGDVFDWQVFTPAAFEIETERQGFRRLTACAGFDETVRPGPDEPRMQFVLERR